MFATNKRFGDLGIWGLGDLGTRGLRDYLSVSFLFVFHIRSGEDSQISVKAS
jgi:hypothetical protein